MGSYKVASTPVSSIPGWDQQKGCERECRSKAGCTGIKGPHQISKARIYGNSRPARGGGLGKLSQTNKARCCFLTSCHDFRPAFEHLAGYRRSAIPRLFLQLVQQFPFVETRRSVTHEKQCPLRSQGSTARRDSQVNVQKVQ